MKKSALLLLFFAFVLPYIPAFSQSYTHELYSQGSDWVIGAKEFEVPQNASSAVKKAAEDIPVLIMEKISKDAKHFFSENEITDRQLYSLQTKRLSLLLQLSGQTKKRDSLVLSNMSSKKLEKQISEAQKNIDETERLIRENLEETHRLKEKISQEKNEYISTSSVVEDVKVYNADSLSLVKENPLKIGLSALISGKIQNYGSFVAVTAELYTYPSSTLRYSTTEIGEINELAEIADNIVQSMIPKIANNIPINLHFAITPKEAKSQAKLFIDDVLYGDDTDCVTVSYGEHKIEVISEGYFSKSISYNFTESTEYSVELPLEKRDDGVFNITFSNPQEGDAYSNTTLIGYIDQSTKSVPVKVNGKSVIGNVVTQNNDGTMSFEYFYADKNLAQNESNLAVNLQKRASAEEINSRRIWAYRAYSAFMLTLPVAFISYGKYISIKDGVSMKAETKDTLSTWSSISGIAAGLAVVSGGFFIVELVKYIKAASTMLPQEAYSLDDKSKKIKTGEN